MKNRRAYALMSVMVFIFMATVVISAAMSHLDYSFAAADARLRKFYAANALESMTNLSLKWLLSEFETGVRPRARAAVDMEYLTDLNFLSIFASTDFTGCAVAVYDLEYSADKAPKPLDETYSFPPSFTGGYMIRAVAEKEGLAPLTQENVYEVEPYTNKLNETPVYSREF